MIILAHGVLGFGSPAWLPSAVNYFNGVALHLGRRGERVIAPQVNPIGSVVDRGNQLGNKILGAVPAGTKAHIIAHSMGGLDARFAIAHVAGVDERIATLVTIGTPHRGSPVADAVANRTDPLFQHVPTMLVASLELSAGALHDLTTAVGSHFDDSTPDKEGVRYLEVAGDASLGGPELFLFQLAAAIGRLRGEVNDGVVTRTSALRPGHQHLPDWPVDHAGEVGWSSHSPLPIVIELPLVPPPAHFARYDAIVDLL